MIKARALAVSMLLALLVGRDETGGQRAEPFHLLETTIDEIHAAYDPDDPLTTLGVGPTAMER